MKDLVPNQYQIEGLINIENQIKVVNDIPVRHLLLLALQDIDVINHQPITSEYNTNCIDIKKKYINFHLYLELNCY